MDDYDDFDFDALDAELAGFDEGLDVDIDGPADSIDLDDPTDSAGASIVNLPSNPQTDSANNTVTATTTDSVGDPDVPDIDAWDDEDLAQLDIGSTEWDGEAAASSDASTTQMPASNTAGIDDTATDQLAIDDAVEEIGTVVESAESDIAITDSVGTGEGTYEGTFSQPPAPLPPASTEGNGHPQHDTERLGGAQSAGGSGSTQTAFVEDATSIGAAGTSTQSQDASSTHVSSDAGPATVHDPTDDKTPSEDQLDDAYDMSEGYDNEALFDTASEIARPAVVPSLSASLPLTSAATPEPAYAQEYDMDDFDSPPQPTVAPANAEVAVSNEQLADQVLGHNATSNTQVEDQPVLESPSVDSNAQLSVEGEGDNSTTDEPLQASADVASTMTAVEDSNIQDDTAGSTEDSSTYNGIDETNERDSGRSVETNITQQPLRTPTSSPAARRNPSSTRKSPSTSTSPSAGNTDDYIGFLRQSAGMRKSPVARRPPSSSHKREKPRNSNHPKRTERTRKSDSNESRAGKQRSMKRQAQRKPRTDPRVQLPWSRDELRHMIWAELQAREDSRCERENFSKERDKQARRNRQQQFCFGRHMSQAWVRAQRETDQRRSAARARHLRQLNPGKQKRRLRSRDPFADAQDAKSVAGAARVTGGYAMGRDMIKALEKVVGDGGNVEDVLAELVVSHENFQSDRPLIRAVLNEVCAVDELKGGAAPKESVSPFQSPAKHASRPPDECLTTLTRMLDTDSTQLGARSDGNVQTAVGLISKQLDQATETKTSSHDTLDDQLSHIFDNLSNTWPGLAQRLAGSWKLKQKLSHSGKSRGYSAKKAKFVRNRMASRSRHRIRSQYDLGRHVGKETRQRSAQRATTNQHTFTDHPQHRTSSNARHKSIADGSRSTRTRRASAKSKRPKPRAHYVLKPQPVAKGKVPSSTVPGNTKRTNTKNTRPVSGPQHAYSTFHSNGSSRSTVHESSLSQCSSDSPTQQLILSTETRLRELTSRAREILSRQAHDLSHSAVSQPSPRGFAHMNQLQSGVDRSRKALSWERLRAGLAKSNARMRSIIDQYAQDLL